MCSWLVISFGLHFPSDTSSASRLFQRNARHSAIPDEVRSMSSCTTQFGQKSGALRRDMWNVQLFRREAASSWRLPTLPIVSPDSLERVCSSAMLTR